MIEQSVLPDVTYSFKKSFNTCFLHFIFNEDRKALQPWRNIFSTCRALIRKYLGETTLRISICNKSWQQHALSLLDVSNCRLSESWSINKEYFSASSNICVHWFSSPTFSMTVIGNLGRPWNFPKALSLSNFLLPFYFSTWTLLFSKRFFTFVMFCEACLKR